MFSLWSFFTVLISPNSSRMMGTSWITRCSRPAQRWMTNYFHTSYFLMHWCTYALMFILSRSTFSFSNRYIVFPAETISKQVEAGGVSISKSIFSTNVPDNKCHKEQVRMNLENRAHNSCFKPSRHPFCGDGRVEVFPWYCQKFVEFYLLEMWRLVVCHLKTTCSSNLI